MSIILLPPPRSLIKAARRLNPAIDLDVDVLAVKQAAGASTKEDWATAVLTQTIATDKGPVTLGENGTTEIFKSAGVANDAITGGRLFRLYEGSTHVGETLWLDFWPNAQIFGPSGFILKEIELVLNRMFGYTGTYGHTLFVARFDENWNREHLTDPIPIRTADLTGAVVRLTIDLRANGRTIRLSTGMNRTRTGTGRDNAGAERTADVTIESGRKISHIEVPNGFSIGISGYAGAFSQEPQIALLNEATFPKFDRTTFWRVATGRDTGPYPPEGDGGGSPLDTAKNPGYGYRETGAVPGYGAIDTTALITGQPAGKWGVSHQTRIQHAAGIAQTWHASDHWNQPWHILRAVKFQASGTVKRVLDLGAAPTNEVHFRADTSEPTGASVTFTARGSTDNQNWTSLGTIQDGKVWTTAETRYRYYEITATLTASIDFLNTPVLNAIFVSERIVFNTFRYARDFDSSTTIDPTTGQSSIGELRLPLLRLGRGDARDIVTKLASDYPLANIEAWVYIRETISGIRHFLNLYRLEDRTPSLGEEEFVFVSGMDRLKAVIPPKKETDQYPSDGTDATIQSKTYNATTKQLTITVAGTPFTGKNITSWRYEGRSGVLHNLNFFISASPSPTTNSFAIVLEDNTQEPQAGDKFHLFSGQTDRAEVSYAGQDFSQVYSDILATQAEVPQRYRGRLPASTARTTSGRLTSDGRPALGALEEVALHCGGAPAWVKGRIEYIDIYGPKGSVETWSEIDYESLRLSVGAGRRMPSVVAKYGYDFVEKKFPYEATFTDGNALIGLGRANLFDVTNLSDTLCQWNDGAEAKHLAEKLMRAWSTGVRVWHVTLVCPRPWRRLGDCVTISTDQYTDRRLNFTADGLTDNGQPIRGRVSAVGVIVGMNLWGTEFDVAILGIENILPEDTTGNVDPTPDPSLQSLNNFRFTDSADGTQRTFLATAGSDIYRVFVFNTLLQAPPLTDPWPLAGQLPTNIIIPDPTSRGITFTVTKPTNGFQRFIQFEPRMQSLATGVVRRAVVDPASPAMAPRISAAIFNFVQADLSVEVVAGPGDWPVTVDVYETNPAGAPIFTATKSANETITKASPGASALGGRSLPLREAKVWWVRLTNVAGQYAWNSCAVDRDPVPEGHVTVNDYRANPQLVCAYDDDVDTVKITLSNGATKVYTQGSGLFAGGGQVVFTIGDAVTTGSPESAFLVDEIRTGYKVEYQGGSIWTEIWRAPLHGVPSNPPTVDPRVVVSTNGDLADVFVGVATSVQEQIRLFMKDAEDAAAPVFGLVLGAADSTPRYVNTGTELGPTDYFFSTGSPLQKLNDIVLTRDQLKRIFVQAQGKDSGVKSPWVPVPLNLRHQPWLESVSLTWDNATGNLRLRARGGANCVSAFFEVSASSSFASPLTASGALVDGAEVTQSFALSGSQRGKTWYGRVTPFNLASLGGLAGAAQIDEEPVPAAYTVSFQVTENTTTGIGTLTLTVGDPGLVIHQTDKIKFYRTVNGTRTLVAPTSAPAGTTGVFTLDSTLEPLHNIKVEPIVYFADGTNTVLTAFTFDRDRIANVVNLTYAINGTNADVKAQFDTDTAVGATNARYRVDGGAFTDVTVAADRTAAFSINLGDSATKLLEVQAKDADGNHGPLVNILLEKYAPLPASLTLETSGSDVIINLAGATVHASWKYAVSTTGMPTDASVDSGTIEDNRTARITKASVVPNLGDRYYVKARPFTGASAGGIGGSYITAEVERQNRSTTKTIRITPQQIATQNPDTDQAQYTLYALTPSAAVAFGSRAQILLPVGATITAFRARARRLNGNGSLTIELFKMTGDEIGSSVSGLLTHSTTGYATLSVSLSETVAAGVAYIVDVIISTVLATNPTDNRFLWAEIDYTAPNLNTTI